MRRQSSELIATLNPQGDSVDTNPHVLHDVADEADDDDDDSMIPAVPTMHKNGNNNGCIECNTLFKT